MRHEEDYALGLVAFVDIFSERNEIVHIAYAVAAALDAVRERVPYSARMVFVAS